MQTNSVKLGSSLVSHNYFVIVGVAVNSNLTPSIGFDLLRVAIQLHLFNTDSVKPDID